MSYSLVASISEAIILQNYVCDVSSYILIDEHIRDFVDALQQVYSIVTKRT